MWHASYSDDGDWDADVARQQSEAAKKKTPAPKRRAYHADGKP